MLEIEIETKKYNKKGNTILQDVNLNIDKAGIYGIIGKNGMGKTTFFKCLLNQTDFTGNISLNKKPIDKESILWLPTEPFLYDELTGKEFIDFYCLLTNNQKKESSYIFDIPKNEFIENYSTGMKKKTYLNALFTKTYDIYILDEPFNGLDIESNLKLMSILKEISKEKIVFISSLILDSLYSNCNEIFLLKDRNFITFDKNQYNNIEEHFLS